MCSGLYLTHDNWVREFESAGFVVSAYQTDESYISTAYLLHKKPVVVKQPSMIDVDDISEFNWIQPLKTAIDERVGEDDARTLWLINKQVTLFSSDDGFLRP